MTYQPTAIFSKPKLFYPESDGQPMADNTLQFEYIVKIKTNLEILYREKEVFVAGDLFWYPVEGRPRTVVAPEVLIAFDRPKGYRGSYKQWEEEGNSLILGDAKAHMLLLDEEEQNGTLDLNAPRQEPLKEDRPTNQYDSFFD